MHINSGTPSDTYLPLISFSKKLITTKMMASKNTQVMYVNKSDNKIVITQTTHNTSTGLTTHRKAKSTTAPSAKLVCYKHTCLIKETCNNYQPLIALASLGKKGQSPHCWEKHLSTLKDSKDKSPYFVVDVNSSTNSHSRSPTRKSKKDNSSNDSDSFTYSFTMTVPIKTIGTTSIENN